MPRAVVRLHVLQNTQFDDTPRLRLPASGQRVRTVQLKRMGNTERQVRELLHPEAVPWRPKTRADCAGVPRPCPYVGCLHHLYLEVSERSPTNLRVMFDGEPWEMAESCSLDVADRGPHTLAAVGRILGVTKQRTQQVQDRALDRALLLPELAQPDGCDFFGNEPRLSRGTTRPKRQSE